MSEEEKKKQEEEDKKRQQIEQKKMIENCPTLLTALKSRVGITYMILQTVLISFGLYMVNSYKNFGQEYISDDKLLTLCGSIGAIFNALGRIINT